MREQDEGPDDLEIVRDRGESRPTSKSSSHGPTATERDIPVPRTVVEKVDPDLPSHGDVPGTAAHSKRQADAIPDVVLQAPQPDEVSVSEDHGDAESPDVSIPTTVITKVDSKPSHGEVPGTDAFDMRKGDAKPDVVEKKGDVTGEALETLLGAVQRAND